MSHSFATTATDSGSSYQQFLASHPQCFLTQDQVVTQLRTWLATLVSLANLYPREQLNIQTKADHTYVTNMDFMLAKLIGEKLATIDNFPVFTEEDVEKLPYEQRREIQAYWLVDPLDGTKTYLNGDGDFSILVSFIVAREAVCTIAVKACRTQALQVEFLQVVKDHSYLHGNLTLVPTVACKDSLELPRVQVTMQENCQHQLAQAEHEVLIARLAKQVTQDFMATCYRLEFAVEDCAVAELQATNFLQAAQAQALRSTTAPSYHLASPVLTLLCGNESLALFGEELPLRRENFTAEIKSSAGVKIIEMLQRPATAYLLGGFMSEWDLAPAMTVLDHLGGGVYDLASGKFLPPHYFNKPKLEVLPCILVTQRELLPYFIDLVKLVDLQLGELINRKLQRKATALGETPITWQELYANILVKCS